MDTVEIFQTHYQFVQFLLIVHKKPDGSFKEPFLGFNSDGGNVDTQITADHARDLVHNTHIVHSEDLQTGKEGDLLILGPLCFYNAVPITGQQTGGVGTISAMYGKPFTRGYETEY